MGVHHYHTDIGKKKKEDCHPHEKKKTQKKRPLDNYMK
jgi:hypothetical protein